VKLHLLCFGHTHQAYSAQRVDFEDQEDKSDFILLLKEYVGKDQARRNEFLTISPASPKHSSEEADTVNATIAKYGK
jgi:hypothetical protein